LSSEVTLLNRNKMPDSNKDKDQSNWKQLSEQFGNDLSDYFSGTAPVENAELLEEFDLDDDEGTDDEGTDEEGTADDGTAEADLDKSVVEPAIVAEEKTAFSDESDRATPVHEESHANLENSVEDEVSSDDNWSVLASSLGLKDAKTLSDPVKRDVRKAKPRNASRKKTTQPRAAQQPCSSQQAKPKKNEINPQVSAVNKSSGEKKSTKKPSKAAPFGGFLSPDLDESEASAETAESSEVLSEMFHATEPLDEVEQSQPKMVDDTIDDTIAFDEDGAFDEDKNAGFDDDDELVDAELVSDEGESGFLEFEVEDLYTETEAAAEDDRRARRSSRSKPKPRRERKTPKPQRPASRSRETDDEPSRDEVRFADVDVDEDEDQLSSETESDQRPRSRTGRNKSSTQRDRDRDRDPKDEKPQRNRTRTTNSGASDKTFPTWSEAVGIIVDTNMSQRRKGKRPVRRKKSRD